MCGRITQTRARLDYIDELHEAYEHQRWVGGDPIQQYNLAPGARILTLHRIQSDGVTRSDWLPWGYRSPAAKAKDYRKHPNAKIESAPANRPWVTERVLVPADGWYEWTGSPGQKQPWYCRLATDRPMFMAAITNYRPGENEGDPELGVAIVTTAADGALADIHSRRPVALGPDEARRWLDCDLQSAEAVSLAKHGLRRPADFEWYKVSTTVNKVVPMSELTIEQAKGLIAPLET